MKKIKLAVFDVNRKGQFEVHAAGCADCAKVHARTGLNCHVAEYGSALEIAADVYSDMVAEGSMTAADGVGELDIKPCVKFKPVDGGKAVAS